jgi:hypothetical protein
MNAELSVNRFEVIANGVAADLELRRHFADPSTREQLGQDLALSWRKLVETVLLVG